MSATASPPRDVLQRTIVVPPDLWVLLKHLAHKDGYPSVQTWAVVRFQELAAARPKDLPPVYRRRI